MSSHRRRIERLEEHYRKKREKMEKMKNQPPPGPAPPFRPEDIASQLVVLLTKDNKISVQYPARLNAEGTGQELDLAKSLELFAAGLQTLASIVRQSDPAPEKPRIIVAPAIPKEFLLKGKL